MAEPQKRKINGQRDAKGRFVKGNNGNPGGRPKQDGATREAMSLLRSVAPDAVQTAISMLRNEETPPPVRVKLIEIILDRTYGKAPQSVEITQSKADIADDIRKILEGRGRE